MIKLILFGFFLFSLHFFAYAQEHPTEIDTTINQRCGVIENLIWMINQEPDFKEKIKIKEKEFEKHLVDFQKENENSKADYVIPCVVHIVYNNDKENISDARVIENLLQTNKDYAGTNERSMGFFNETLRAATGISFCLATSDPDGNPTNGITRTSTSQTLFTHDNKVKFTSQGGSDAWDPDRYFNIWVCNLGQNLCGYGQFPYSGINATYGVVINYACFGKTGANSNYNGGGTLTHEIGHCLNLRHIWGDDQGLCTGDDLCSDTPNQADASSGYLTGLITDACTQLSPGIMYMNFMDYSYDKILANFTPKQTTRMRTAIQYYLTSLVNAAPTVCAGMIEEPVADFYADTTYASVGDSVSLINVSSNNPISYQWTIKPLGGWSYIDGTNSTSRNPKILFSYEGKYSITLSVGNMAGIHSLVKTNYITVTNNSGVEEYLHKNILIIYPNPTINSLTVDFNNKVFQNIEISIINAIGEQVKSFNSTTAASNIKLDLSDMVSGLYFVKVKLPEYTITKKILLLESFKE